MGVQILKLDINPEFVSKFNELGLTYRRHSIISQPSGCAYECLGPSVPLEFEPTSGGLTIQRGGYTADRPDFRLEQGYSVFLAEEFAAELNQILQQVSLSTGGQADELKHEYLGLFPLVANDRGLFNISIDLVPGGLDEYGAPAVKNKFFVTCRELNASCHPGRVFSCLWEFSP
jgi:hypothetical protein